MALRRGGAGAGAGIRIKKKARSFMCGGCGGSKAVSISDGSSDKQSPISTPPPANTSSTTTASAGNKTATTTTAASYSFSPSSTDGDADMTSVGSTPSVAALLRQLGELERSVRSLRGAVAADDDGKNGGGGGGRRRHRRTVSDGCGGGSGRVEESVAVVKESADPLADFRRSMLQMIVEKEIVGGAELRELLHRFLSLNSPHHHHVILRAFAEIWEEVFSGYERTPDFLVSHRRTTTTKKKLPAYYAAAAAAADEDDDSNTWIAA
uniref:Transcription repressor n=1 Tax=Leersia perrieri TaxID=77586 RepID=A0A0D9XLU2_9ORYZ